MKESDKNNRTKRTLGQRPAESLVCYLSWWWRLFFAFFILGIKHLWSPNFVEMLLELWTYNQGFQVVRIPAGATKKITKPASSREPSVLLIMMMAPLFCVFFILGIKHWWSPAFVEMLLELCTYNQGFRVVQIPVEATKQTRRQHPAVKIITIKGHYLWESIFSMSENASF